MTPEMWIGTLGVVFTLMASAVGYGVLQQRITDLENARAEDKEARSALLDLLEKLRLAEKELVARDLTELRGRVAEAQATATAAQAAAGEVRILATAVQHLTERVGAEMKHLTEQAASTAMHLHARLDGVMEAVKAIPPPRAARLRAKTGTTP